MVRRSLVLPLLLASLPALAKPPRLTLFVAVDSLSSELLLRTRPRLKFGLARMMNEGAYFPVARYEAAECVTSIGHATLATGAWAWRHGVVGNRHLNRATGKLEPAFFDPSHPVLEAPAGVEDGSPVVLLAETFSDRLRAATALKGKSVVLSGKARSAVALAGKLGDAWWFHDQVGRFVTGTWYRKEVPTWMKSFNDRRLPDTYHPRTWELTEAPKLYSGEDDRPMEADAFGLGRTFPHPLGGGLPTPGPQSWSALAWSPMMNEVLVEAAKAAMDGEQLGKDDVPDLLAVLFSPLDRTYHLYGPTSWEVQDHLLRLDRAVGELLAAAERAAGRGNVLVVLSADHGGANVPEEWAGQGLDAARVAPTSLQQGLDEELARRFGVSSLVAALEQSDVYLDHRVIEGKKLDLGAVRRAAAAWLAKEPHVQLAVAREDLPTTDAHGLGGALRHSFHPQRSGDVLVVLKPFRVLEQETRGTSHGTPWAYDAEVPVVLWGRGVRPGLHARRVAAVDIAPTITALLELGAPAMNEGAPLTEAIVLSR